jgi:HAD superfamily hydrolase (TIGR01484 family)
MELPIKIISTDFDGTLHADHENPPVPTRLQALIGDLQRRGAKWVINTGRDLSSLMEGLGRAHLSIQPDWVVVVEREIYFREGPRFFPLQPWNGDCERAHRDLFKAVEKDLPRLFQWVNGKFHASVYSDSYSPFCLIAGTNADADDIEAHLRDYCESVPNLTVVRNDVYARFSHGDYNKGTALAEIARRLGLGPEVTFAAGDHWNDLPMLRREHARFIAAPANAVPEVKAQVEEHGGYLSSQHCGHGVTRSLEYFLEQHGALAGL